MEATSSKFNSDSLYPIFLKFIFRGYVIIIIIIIIITQNWENKHETDAWHSSLLIIIIIFNVNVTATSTENFTCFFEYASSVI